MTSGGDVVGKTIIAERYEPDNFGCWAVLNDDNADRLDLQEPGIVYEILEGRGEDHCYGIVEKTIKLSERSPVSEQLSIEAPPGKEPITTSLMRLSIFRESGIAAPVGRHPMRMGDADSILQAYDMSREGLAIGIYTLLSGLPPQICKVNLPPEYVLGPQAAHINVGGKTGYAKTAWSLLCCKSILSNEEIAEETCVIAFNVKADDLLWVDKENTELDEEDRKLYELMGLEAEPFEDVQVFAPEHPLRREHPNSLRFDATPFSWRWRDVKQQLYFAISPEDWDDRLESLLTDLSSIEEIQDFDDVVNTLQSMVEEDRGSWVASPSGANHHRATVYKAKRIFDGMLTRFKGLIDGHSDPLPTKQLLKNGRFSVVDTRMLSTPGQRLVFSKVHADTLRMLEEGTAEVRKVIYLIDELNKFAPRSPRDPISMIKAVVDEIAERGRSVGAILLGIEQYPSAISDATTGNVSTMVFTRMKPTELDAALYRGLSLETKKIIQRLPKGYAIVQHDTFTSPILIRYPRPPCSQKRPIEYGLIDHIERSLPTEEADKTIREFKEILTKSRNEIESHLEDLAQNEILPGELVHKYLQKIREEPTEAK